MSKAAIVTGANQGLGYALVKALSRRLVPGDTVYLAARSEEHRRAAVDALVKAMAAGRASAEDRTASSIALRSAV